MDGSDPSLSQPSRRRKIKGPRPTPLDVRTDSRKIIKRQLPAPPRRPLIIYTVSPKVIHAHRSEFMSLVQRLTGLASPALPPASPPPPLISQAARPATSEKTAGASSHPLTIGKQLAEVLDQLGIDAAMRATAAAGGVLSQVPSCLPETVSPELFTVAQRSVKSFDELSPALIRNGMVVATPSLWELVDQNQDL
ncbi:protein MKS1-like [Zingiber officinale]|uniref:VQ domain-containing protein n=1 Tax=Zingiber officinale TaxID=94328 RepID=A0A8J5FW03_ZINOF|nr:protein MKS1-like [Zingiber officinale]KAG6491502.1 hypothetical protein ZIOFF_046434 [Zingiber officinale]